MHNNLLYSIICRSRNNAALLRKTNVDYVKPEQVKAFELGYRSFISDVSVDRYYNIYNDFIGNLNVVAPYYGTAQDNPSTNPGSESKDMDPGFTLAASDFRVYQYIH
jgi:hypothetical protein